MQINPVLRDFESKSATSDMAIRTSDTTNTAIAMMP
jgi:hypothetical protein